MLSKQSRIIADIYNNECNAYGDVGWQAALWASPDNQMSMFDVMSQIGDLNKRKILDIGCGQGDLYNFFKSKYPDFEYEGIDVSEKMIEHAKKKLVGINFSQQDFFDYDFQKTYDYLFAPGTFSFHVYENQYDYLEYAINKMFNLANIGISFSALSENLVETKNDILAYYKPPKVLEFCLKITNQILINHCSVPNQFIIFMFKRPFLNSKLAN